MTKFFNPNSKTVQLEQKTRTHQADMSKVMEQIEMTQDQLKVVVQQNKQVQETLGSLLNIQEAFEERLNKIEDFCLDDQLKWNKTYSRLLRNTQRLQGVLVLVVLALSGVSLWLALH